METQTQCMAQNVIADGGMIGGGIMDAAGRQQYFLGKLVKKAKRLVKKIVKSPVGKLGLGPCKDYLLDLWIFWQAHLGKCLELLNPLVGRKLALEQVGIIMSTFNYLEQEEEDEQPIRIYWISWWLDRSKSIHKKILMMNLLSVYG